MSENTTQGLPDANTFEERVFAQFGGINAHFRAVNARFDRLETRLDSVESRLTSLEAKVDAQGERLTAIEDRVDARLRETRPIWEAVLSRLDSVEGEIKTIRRTLRIFHKDMIAERHELEEPGEDVEELGGRVEKLESGRTP